MQDLHSIEIDGVRRRRLFGIEGNQGLIPHQHHDLKCPRCESLNTKFCYYNNYNLSQPRHFCRSCKRYWTNGGVLRNVPVGGGIRKAKRSAKLNSKTSVPCSETVATEGMPLISENSSGNSASVTANTTSVNIAATTKGRLTFFGSKLVIYKKKKKRMVCNEIFKQQTEFSTTKTYMLINFIVTNSFH